MRNWVAFIEDKMLNFVIRVTGTEVSKEGLCAMVSSVLSRLKKYFHIFKLKGPSNSPWKVGEAERIFPFLCTDLSLQLVKKPKFSHQVRAEVLRTSCQDTLREWSAGRLLFCLFSYTMKMQILTHLGNYQGDPTWLLS